MKNKLTLQDIHQCQVSQFVNSPKVNLRILPSQPFTTN